MSRRQRLSELEEARQLLVLQGDLHRALIRLEVRTLRERFTRLAAVKRTHPLLFAGTALAGLLAARRWRSVLRWAPVVVPTYRWLGRLLKRRG